MKRDRVRQNRKLWYIICEVTFPRYRRYWTYNGRMKLKRIYLWSLLFIIINHVSFHSTSVQKRESDRHIKYVEYFQVTIRCLKWLSSSFFCYHSSGCCSNTHGLEQMFSVWLTIMVLFLGHNYQIIHQTVINFVRGWIKDLADGLLLGTGNQISSLVGSVFPTSCRKEREEKEERNCFETETRTRTDWPFDKKNFLQRNLVNTPAITWYQHSRAKCRCCRETSWDSQLESRRNDIERERESLEMR